VHWFKAAEGAWSHCAGVKGHAAAARWSLVAHHRLTARGFKGRCTSVLRFEEKIVDR
jgi:hypothetical protein